MKKSLSIYLIVLNGLLVFSACGQNSKSKKNMELSSEKDTVSYSLGVNIAKNLQQQGFEEIDVDVLSQAFSDVYNDKDLKISQEEGGAFLNKYMMAKQQQKAEANVSKGKEFLEENKKKEGVKVTESGLQYIVIEEGTGEQPAPTDQVTVHYTGKTIDGKVFDSSVQRGQPATFGLNQVIPGWTEGLQLMKEGAKYKFFIPSELAYGQRGAGGDIGPNETLIFDVELIEVQKK